MFASLINLPIISTTDYQLASSIELDIENGRNFICGMVCMTEDGLHALKPRKLVKIYSSLDISICFAEMRVQPSE